MATYFRNIVYSLNNTCDDLQRIYVLQFSTLRLRLVGRSVNQGRFHLNCNSVTRTQNVLPTFAARDHI
jgi:hypothetical protein